MVKSSRVVLMRINKRIRKKRLREKFKKGAITVGGNTVKLKIVKGGYFLIRRCRKKFPPFENFIVGHFVGNTVLEEHFGF